MSDTFNPQEILSGLKKPLDKMTVKELKELAISSFPQIVGASGKQKEDLLAEIKQALGIVEEEGGASPYAQQIRTLKKTIAQLKVKKNQIPKTQRMEREKLRKQIHALKKKTRRLAAV
jgi:vacuolar-type H+-ATPase subunit I/STV1